MNQSLELLSGRGGRDSFSFLMLMDGFNAEHFQPSIFNFDAVTLDAVYL